ncbi:hypothetical protein ACTL31_01880 [Leuconostoc mesenteroides]
MNSQEKLQQQVIDSLQIIIEIEQSLIDEINQLLLANPSLVKFFQFCCDLFITNLF